MKKLNYELCSFQTEVVPELVEGYQKDATKEPCYFFLPSTSSGTGKFFRDITSSLFLHNLDFISKFVVR